MNLPNIITLARILLVPVFVVIYLWPGDGTYLIAATLFALAAATDWLDGYLARRLNQTTPFGAFLDPVADNSRGVCANRVVGATFNGLAYVTGLIIIGREIMISALREWMAEMNSSVTVAVSYLGKIKTSLQMIAIAVLLALPPNSDSGLIFAGYTLLYVAALMTFGRCRYIYRPHGQLCGRGLRQPVNKSKEPT